MVEYPYKLQPYKTPSSRYTCPGCGERKSFARYIDTETGEQFGDNVGRCNREVNCGYHKKPKEHFADNGHLHANKPYPFVKSKATAKTPAFIPYPVLNSTLNGWGQNVFIQNLLLKHRPEDVERIISQYYLGTITEGYMNGSITLPFIDRDGNVRAIQVKQFDEANHTTKTSFIHSIIEHDSKKKMEPPPTWLVEYLKNDLKVSCLFGEHLLNKFPDNPVALVEAPKTALYGTMYFGFPDNPQNYLWLAVFNLSSLTFDKVKVLKGRMITLFPDLSKPQPGKPSALELWSMKANEFNRMFPLGTRFEIDDKLELYASELERKAGLDMADYLAMHEPEAFRNALSQPTPQTIEHAQSYKEIELSNRVTPSIGEPQQNKKEQAQLLYPLEQTNDLTEPEAPETENWDDEVKEIEDYFKAVTQTDIPVKLNDYTTITNLPGFIHSHLSFVKANNGNSTYLPYLERLRGIKQYLNGRGGISDTIDASAN